MKTIKIIDLLNMIASGEKPPKKIKVKTPLDINTNYIYIKEEYNYRSEIYTNVWLLKNLYKTTLEQEIEIIEEEKEMEKSDVLEHCVDFSKNENVLLDNQLRLQKKINELMDAVNELKRGN